MKLPISFQTWISLLNRAKIAKKIPVRFRRGRKRLWASLEKVIKKEAKIVGKTYSVVKNYFFAPRKSIIIRLNLTNNGQNLRRPSAVCRLPTTVKNKTKKA